MDTTRYNYQCSNTLFDKIFVTSPGAPYSNPVSYSHYNQPLGANGIRGESRVWGDASFETQKAAIDEIIKVGTTLKFSDYELAFALAVARTESGFNPDAAAGTTSASGIGQLINRTAKNLGIPSEKRFDLKENIRGFLTLLSDNLKSSKKQLGDVTQERIFERAYGLYHDGPSLSYGGEKLAKKSVLPHLPAMLDWLFCNPLKTLN